jgi:hypothetical protein
MWNLKEPIPVKLIIGILAANEQCLKTAVDKIQTEFGKFDFTSPVWPFTQTNYYKDELGTSPLRQFISIDQLINPGQLAQIKHKTNKLEQESATGLNLNLPRPVNLDPGIIEPSKLILATTKNYSHRIYIGNKMYAEVTLIYDKKNWHPFEYTYPDYRQQCYFDFFTNVRERLLEQLKQPG